LKKIEIQTTNNLVIIENWVTSLKINNSYL
jgi:hypothetical protein